MLLYVPRSRRMRRRKKKIGWVGQNIRFPKAWYAWLIPIILLRGLSRSFTPSRKDLRLAASGVVAHDISSFRKKLSTVGSQLAACSTQVWRCQPGGYPNWWSIRRHRDWWYSAWIFSRYLYLRLAIFWSTIGRLLVWLIVCIQSGLLVVWFS